MKSFAVAAAIGATVAGASTIDSPLAPRSSSLPEVTVKGNGKKTMIHRQKRQLTREIAFFAGNDRFYIRGVDYQPGISHSYHFVDIL